MSIRLVLRTGMCVLMFLAAVSLPACQEPRAQMATGDTQAATADDEYQHPRYEEGFDSHSAE